MVKRGSTRFSATKVTKAGLVASAALQKIMDLEQELSRLWHHVSVLSKRNYVVQKEVAKGKREVEVADSEVASPGRVEEPEPRVVAELSDQVIKNKLSVAAGVAGVRLARVATPEVAEPNVAREFG